MLTGFDLQKKSLLLSNASLALVDSALSLLEKQLERARKDLNTIQTLKQDALINPDAFVAKISAKVGSFLLHQEFTGMPKLQTIIAVPNIDNFNSGVNCDQKKLFPQRPSVIPRAVYEVGRKVERPASAPDLGDATPKKSYLNEYVTVDTSLFANHRMSLDTPTSALSSPASSPPGSSPPHISGAGKTSLRLAVSSQSRQDSLRSFSTSPIEAASSEESHATRSSSRRSTSDYARRSSCNTPDPKSRRNKRKSVNFMEEPPDSPSSPIVKPQAKRYTVVSF